MNDPVAQIAKEWRSSAFTWGSSDCLLSIADYVLLRTGVDYGAEFRGTYSDESGALAHVKEFGGEAALIDLSGLPRASGTPQHGDIVLCLIRGEPTAGICTGSGVLFRRLRGAIELELRFLHVQTIWRF